MPSDLFAAQADAYRAFRPTYPPALFDWLAAQAPARTLAWDCACGSGQATLDLAARFGHVTATDTSQQQLDQAPRHPRIDYRREGAERSSLEHGAVDLTLVAQALHWFDHPAFFAEVQRVSARGALFAAVTYNLLHIAPAIDAVVADLYWTTLRGYWSPERSHVEDNYAGIPLPFPRVAAPPFEMTAQWQLPHLIGYLRSWSAVATYQARHQRDPVAACTAALTTAWGDPSATREVRFPLTILAGRVAP